MSPRSSTRPEPRKRAAPRSPARAPRAAAVPKAKAAAAPRAAELRAWVATADMGLGHQRAAYPLRDIAEGGLITLGKAENTSNGEHKLWERLRRSYEFLSRTKSWPIIGNAV